jgi:hypothetical protein
VAGSYEHGHEVSGSMIGWGFLDQLNDYHLLKQDCVPWSSS